MDQDGPVLEGQDRLIGYMRIVGGMADYPQLKQRLGELARSIRNQHAQLGTLGVRLEGLATDLEHVHARIEVRAP